MAASDILNPTATDVLNPDFGMQQKMPITHVAIKASDGPGYSREVSDLLYQYSLSWGSTRNCAKSREDMQRLKRFYQQFRKGFFTIIDYEDGGRHHVGHFVTPVEPVRVGNLYWSAQNVLWEEVPGVPMASYPSDWDGDSIWEYTLTDHGEIQPAPDDYANWTLTDDAHSASPAAKDFQSAVADAFVQLEYVGWGFQLWAPKGPALGIAEIFLDGVSQGTVDLYAAAAADSASLLEVQDVPLAKHLVKMVCTHAKNGSSSDYTVVWDALKVMR